MLDRIDKAIDAFSNGLQSADGYAAEQTVWLYIAQLRAGKPDLAELNVNASNAASSDDMRLVIDFFRGAVTTDQLAAAAESYTDAEKWRKANCRIGFFVGLNELARGNQEVGRKSLAKTRVFCRAGDIESHAAEYFLKEARPSAR